jgi:hypothetical protein
VIAWPFARFVVGRPLPGPSCQQHNNDNDHRNNEQKKKGTQHQDPDQEHESVLQQWVKGKPEIGTGQPAQSLST